MRVKRDKRKASVAADDGADGETGVPVRAAATKEKKSKQQSTPFGGGGAKFAEAFGKIISAVEEVKAEAVRFDAPLLLFCVKFAR